MSDGEVQATKAALLVRVREMAADWKNYWFSDTARWDLMKSGKFDFSDVAYCLTNARGVAFAARGSLVVEGRSPNRRLLNIVFRVTEDGQLCIIKLIG